MGTTSISHFTMEYQISPTDIRMKTEWDTEEELRNCISRMEKKFPQFELFEIIQEVLTTTTSKYSAILPS